MTNFWEKIIKRESIEESKIRKMFSATHSAAEEVIMDGEVECFLKKIKNRKAAGSYKIVEGFIKNGREKLKRTIYNLFTKVFETGNIPKDWRKSRIELINKGGEK